MQFSTKFSIGQTIFTRMRGPKFINCPACDATKKIGVYLGGVEYVIDCPVCKATGKVPEPGSETYVAEFQVKTISTSVGEQLDISEFYGVIHEGKLININGLSAEANRVDVV